MDPYGLHFQKKQKAADALAKVAKQWEHIHDKRAEREGKLVDLDGFVPVCCNRLCCCGAIETVYLRELRRKFLDCTTQVERKRYLINLRNAESPTGYSIVEGDCE